MRRCFRKAAALFDPAFEDLEVPFEGGRLPAYVMRSEESSTPRPTLIVLGGGDTYVEDLYFWGAAAALSRR